MFIHNYKHWYILCLVIWQSFCFTAEPSADGLADPGLYANVAIGRQQDSAGAETALLTQTLQERAPATDPQEASTTEHQKYLLKQILESVPGVRSWILQHVSLSCTLSLGNNGIEPYVATQDGPERMVFVTSGSRKAYLCDSRSGECLLKIGNRRNTITGVALQPATGGLVRVLLTSDDGKARVFHGKSGKCEYMVDHAPSGPDCPAQFNREGCKLLTVKGAQATLFSIEEHDKKEQVKLAHQLIGHNRPITSAVFNAQGTKIATGSHDGSVHLWDVYTGNCTAVFDLNPYIKSTAYSDPILKVAFNSAGTLLAVAANPAILIFDMATQEVICKKLNALQGPCCAMRFIEDNGEFLETIGDDSCARRWDLRGFNRISTLLDTLTPGQAELLVDMYDHGKKTADPYVINECPLTEHWATLHTDIKSLFTDLVASK